LLCKLFKQRKLVGQRSLSLDPSKSVNDFNKERFNVYMGQFSSTKLRKEIMSKSSLRGLLTYSNAGHNKRK
jgi:hypothetical protein